jgi:hypothetical protein
MASRRGKLRRSGALRRLAEPEPVSVRLDRQGRPAEVGGKPVVAIREWWLIEDRWWTAAPVQRHYWELVDDRGSSITVFRQPDDVWRAHS